MIKPTLRTMMVALLVVAGAAPASAERNGTHINVTPGAARRRLRIEKRVRLTHEKLTQYQHLISSSHLRADGHVVGVGVGAGGAVDVQAGSFVVKQGGYHQRRITLGVSGGRVTGAFARAFAGSKKYWLVAKGKTMKNAIPTHEVAYGDGAALVVGKESRYVYQPSKDNQYLNAGTTGSTELGLLGVGLAVNPLAGVSDGALRVHTRQLSIPLGRKYKSRELKKIESALSAVKQAEQLIAKGDHDKAEAVIAKINQSELWSYLHHNVGSIPKGK